MNVAGNPTLAAKSTPTPAESNVAIVTPLLAAPALAAVLNPVTTHTTALLVVTVAVLSDIAREEPT